LRFAFIEQHRKEFAVALMCKVLQVTRSGFYAWRKRPICARAMRRRELVRQIKQVHEDSRQTYGSPRITVDLGHAGMDVSENTVAKYMRECGLFVRPSGRFVPQTTDSAHPHPIAPNLLQQDFAASAPNQKWACDLTYIWTAQGWLYLSVVIDLFSRRVVGWSMSNRLRSWDVAAALEMALKRRKPAAGLIHHSDRGVQYACGSYRQMLADHQIAVSMSRRGNCYDNAIVESFFATLKSELVHRRRFATRAGARACVFEWIECWYNRRRRHSSLGDLSPEAFEAQNN
jgi:transposase InsO family protein